MVRCGVSVRWMLLVVMSVGMVLALAAPPATAEPLRVFGEDRIATAVAASQHGWDSAETALLATGDDFPDALGAAALAASLDAPVLLTDPSALPGQVAEELERLGVTQVRVLGGTAAVADAVIEEVAALTGAPAVERIHGVDRFATAAAAARRAGAPGGEAALVLGSDFPDAVSAGALSAGDAPMPVLLTETDAVPEATLAALADLAVSDVLLVGGTAVISEAIEEQLTAAGLATQRLAGANRYATSTAVAREAEERVADPTTLIMATGAGFADALAAAPLAARLGGVLALVSPHQPDPDSDAYLRERADRWNGALTLGGTAALSAEALTALTLSMSDEAHPEPEPEPDPEPGEIAVAEARTHLGTRYEFGGNGPDSFDCSGLTRWAWQAAGVALPRVSRDQYAAFPRVSMSELEPGDLIAYDYDRVPGVSHIAIYSGQGNMIHATPNNSRAIPGQVMEEPVWRSSALVGAVRPG